MQDQWLFGHPGMGGQNVKVDLTNKVSFAYLCNGLKTGFGDFTVTFMRLQNALYECLRQNHLLQGLPEMVPSATLKNTPVETATG